MDPENSSMRVRLAEVYLRLNKKTEAWQIFSAAAESLRSKGSLSAAEEILQRMLTLDPGNTYALLMQGKNMIESGDAAGRLPRCKKFPTSIPIPMVSAICSRLTCRPDNSPKPEPLPASC